MSTASSGGSRNEKIPVSVVIPCFQCADTVGRAIRSVASQSVSPAELILVDDASSDASVSTCRAEISRYPGEVSLIQRPTNGGAASARNTGWAVARYKYVAFLDADASWHARKLEVQFQFMEQHPELTLSGHSRVILQRAVATQAVNESPGHTPVAFADLLWGNAIAPSTMMVRRDANHRFPEGQRHMEDHRFLLDLARRGDRLALIHSPLAAHYKPDFGAGGLSGNLTAMEKAELGNYKAVFLEGDIGTLKFAVVCGWSIAKFARRLAIVASRR